MMKLKMETEAEHISKIQQMLTMAGIDISGPGDFATCTYSEMERLIWIASTLECERLLRMIGYDPNNLH
jgi:hypothetical protein